MGLDAKDFTKGLSKSRDRVEKFKAGVRRAGIGIAGFGAAIGFATKQSTEWAAELERASSMAGVTTDTLQELQQVAGRFGVEQDIVNGSLEEFSIRIGDALEGTGPLFEAFNTLNIELKDSQNNLKGTRDLFFEVVNGLNQVSDEAKRVQLADKLFGGDGTKFLNVLEKGGDRLRDMMTSASRFNIDEKNVERLAKMNEHAKQMADQFNFLKREAISNLAFGLSKAGGFLGLTGGAFDPTATASEIANQEERIAEMREELKRRTGEQADQQNKVAEAQKAAEEAAKKDLETQRQKTKELEQQRQEQQRINDKVQEAQRRLEAARLERSKFNVGELARSNLVAAQRAGAPQQFFQDVQSARRVMRLERFAERAKGVGRLDLATEAFSRSDEVRRGILALRESERRPFAVLEKQVTELQGVRKETQTVAENTAPIREASN